MPSDIVMIERYALMMMMMMLLLPIVGNAISLNTQISPYSSALRKKQVPIAMPSLCSKIRTRGKLRESSSHQASLILIL
eukprot:1036394-Amphidinium_carterae.1